MQKNSSMAVFNNVIYFFYLMVALAVTSCHIDENEKSATGNQQEVSTLFTLLSPEKTQIRFNNKLTEGLNTNVMAYEYFYNGGGVAVGDINGDGWEDIYFSGNMVSNKLYLNRGGENSVPMQFQDITSHANVAGRKGPWKTGVTMADVNGDGLLDIYVCYSGNMKPNKRRNQLFINKGPDDQNIPRFEDQAELYGLATTANSTQAVFFDYDRDSDLDMFLLNHSPSSLPVLDEASTAEILKKESPTSGIRLFRQDLDASGLPHFRDVTEKTGLQSSPLTYGLGAGIADVNKDGWLDIYVSNDYAIPDYLYINNKNGTFTDRLKDQLGHVSHFSMGNDIADINNDGLPDIYTLDMLPEDNRRQKLLFAPDNYEQFNLNLKMGFHYQYMRNMLHINNGNGTYNEIGQLSGIATTDWSWAPLLADYDNDGWKDLFVTNGYVRDYTNMDFIKYMGDFLHKKQGNLLRKDILELVKKMPSSNVVNYIFRNNKDLTFSNATTEWGLDLPSNSNGAAYADLDNDGDMDLVVNNINKPAFIYRNESDNQLRHNYLKVKLQGSGKNRFGIGAKVMVYDNGGVQFLEQMPSRGYQSSVSPILHFGLGLEKEIDSLRVIWQSGEQQVMGLTASNQVVTLNETQAASTYAVPGRQSVIYNEVKPPILFQHEQNALNDFKRQPLMVNPLSFSGPCMVKGDVNGDGLQDLYIGGAAGQAGQLYLQESNSEFMLKQTISFDDDRFSEDVNAIFFDANGDSFQDLYVSSGGYGNFMPKDEALQDRLYLNDGKGNFSKSVNALPAIYTSSSCARISDINGDGYGDIFIGGRVIPGRYPETPQSYLLINDGKGRFTDMTKEISPELQNIGMVTDAAWIDINSDNKNDLVVVGEWMPVMVFINADGKLTDRTSEYFDKRYTGWWNELLVDDFNDDGKPDLIVGNMGLNTQCKASDTEPAEIFFKDFDENGSVDPIFCFYIQGKSYPSVTRDELLDQINMMRTRFTDYKSYADATLTDIFTEEELINVKHFSANELKTQYFESTSNGKFKKRSLPMEVQSSPVFTITKLDYNKDGKHDLLFCGNINNSRLRFGKTDANYGILLEGDGNGGFSYVPQHKSGFEISGDVRSVLQVNKTLLFGINQKEMKAYKVN